MPSALAFFLVQSIGVEALNFYDGRGISASPVVVALKETSPAFKALNEVHMDFHKEPAVEKEIPTIEMGKVTLNSGGFSHKNLMKILKESPQPKINTLAANEVPALEGISISLSDVDSYEQEDSTNDSFQEKAQRLIQAELDYRKKTKILEKKFIATTSGQPIYVGKPNVSLPKSASGERQNSRTSSLEERKVVDYDTPTRDSMGEPRPDIEGEPEGPGVADIAKGDGQVAIHGFIELEAGLAYGGEKTYFTVYQVFDGEIQSSGEVSIENGSYEILVEKLQGYLVAELTDSRGLVLGTAEKDLYKLELPKVGKQNKINNVNLIVTAATAGAHVEVISSDSFDGYKFPVSDVKVTMLPFETEMLKNAEGIFVEPSFEPGSDLEILAEAPGHWPTMTRIQTGKPQSVRLFSEKRVEAMLEFSKIKSQSSDAIRTTGIVWGRVTKKGKPVMGATVEVTSEAPLQVSYFKDYFVDKTQKSTGLRGDFAIVVDHEELIGLRVRHNNKVYPAQIVSVKDGMITWIEVNFDDYETEQVVFTSTDESHKESTISVRVLGEETAIGEELIIDGGASKMALSLLSGNGFRIWEVDSGEPRSIVRVESPMSSRYLELPLLPLKWEENYFKQSKNHGFILGWPESKGFEVLIDNGKSSAMVNYFNEAGEVVSPNEAIYFVATGVEPGKRSVMILPSESLSVLTRIAHVDAGIASVVPLKSKTNR